MGAISAYEKQKNEFYRFDLSVNDCLRRSLHDLEFAHKEELQIDGKL